MFHYNCRFGCFVKWQQIIFPLLFLTILLNPSTGSAHCDGLDGPVIRAAKKALESHDVNLVLIWVQPRDEAEIIKAFKQTLMVRELNAEAKKLADMYFFETLVRIHRAGEGAPYTGLKPAGRNLGPAIPTADKALQTGSTKEIRLLLTKIIEQGLYDRFTDALRKKNYEKEDIKAGRNFVEAYVRFLHYVEPIYEAASKSPDETHVQTDAAGHSH